MKKILQTVLVDDDVFDELCSYPDHRVKFIGESVEINENVDDEKLKDIALKALEQEPICETLTSGYVQEITLSPVTPAVKMGQWIKYGAPRCGEQHYQCTSCEYYINFGQWGKLYTKEFKYCPNCGAKMQETKG